MRDKLGSSLCVCAWVCVCAGVCECECAYGCALRRQILLICLKVEREASSEAVKRETFVYVYFWKGLLRIFQN